MNFRRSFTLLGMLLLLISVPGFAQKLITCSSNYMKRNYCNAGGARDVRLVRQISGSACIQGKTWGIQGNQIWVDRGCSADFQVMVGGHQGGAQIVRCESNSTKYVRCRTNGRVARVELNREISGSRCVQGRTFGFDQNGVWVDKGCRADFRVWYR